MSSATAGASADLAHTSRRAIVAACVGNAAEWYDFAIYGSLATVIGLVFFPTQDLATALSAAFATYGTAFLVRPWAPSSSVGWETRTAAGQFWFAWSSSWLRARRAVAGIRHDWSARAGCPGAVTLPLKGSPPEENSVSPRYSSWRTRTTHEEPDCSLAHSDDGDWNRNRHGCGRRALLPFQRDRS